MAIHGINERPLNQTQQTQVIRKQTDELKQAELHKNDFDYVTLSDKYRPARVKRAENGSCTVACMVLNDKGIVSNRFDRLHYTASNPQELRKKITAAFPNAVFSLGNPEVDPRAQYNQEVKEKQATRQREKEQRDFDIAVVEQHKVLADQMSPEQRQEYIVTALQWFINDSEWKDWFRSHLRFFSYPNEEGRNRETLPRYCRQHGFAVPNHSVLDEAMQYLLNNNHFYLKPSYKRSEADEMNAVREYVQDDPNARTSTFSDTEIEEATRKLRARLPVGSVPSSETIQAIAKSVGISDALLNAITGRKVSGPAPVNRSASAKELKETIRDERNRARGGAFRPSETIRSV